MTEEQRKSLNELAELMYSHRMDTSLINQILTGEISLFRWIDAEEGLPEFDEEIEEYHECFFLTKDGNSYKGQLVEFDGAKYWTGNKAAFQFDEVTHWAPIPPQKGGAE